MRSSLKLLIGLSLISISAGPIFAAEPAPTFTVKLETVLKHDDGQFLWFHPRAAAIPGSNRNEPQIVMTLQKHLKVSDFYSGLHVLRQDHPGGTWSGPVLPPELDWRKLDNGITISVADVTPGFHPQTGKVIAIGAQVRYSTKGHQLDDVPRAHCTAYTVLDPKSNQWSGWQTLELPAGKQFNFARNACAQWVVRPNGNVLIPLYIAEKAKSDYGTTVAEFSFDGQKFNYVQHGNVLEMAGGRGLHEPSLVEFGGKFYLTMRNEKRGYVSVSDDGLNFKRVQPWQFDDGSELGSYNTQQHWLAHSHGLFLVYTRRGANNDHIFRHRAPLFMGQVDPVTLKVIRKTEKIVIAERGADLGNFGCNYVSPSESWITVSEGVFTKEARKRGAEGATFVARIRWSQPNQLQGDRKSGD